MVTTPRLAVVSLAYTNLLHAMASADAAAARGAARALLAAGEPPARVYRVALRTLLARAVDSNPAAAAAAVPDDLLALNAALFLSAALPSAEGAALLARAIGAATAALPASFPAPQALPLAGWRTRPAANDLRTTLLAGDAPAAEWALAVLLAGSSGGATPDLATRRAAYTALFAAAAQLTSAAVADNPVVTSRSASARLLPLAQHAAEMAELLPPALTLLALRPVLPALAAYAAPRAASAPTIRPRSRTERARPASAPSPATPIADDEALVSIQSLDCALRVNHRPARPGETLQWAQAMRAGETDVARVVEEALASGMALSALLDAALLAALLVPPRMAPAADNDAAVAALLCLHAARRAQALSDAGAATLAAALAAFQHFVRAVPVQPQTARNHARALLAALLAAAAGDRATSLARAAATATDTASRAILLAEAVLAEADEARDRDPEYGALLLAAADPWVRRSEPPTPLPPPVQTHAGAHRSG